MHVLFIDDDAVNRHVARDMLSVAGVQMAEADSALKGVDMIEAGDFDCVLMDLRMPGVNGLEALRLIRARADAKRSLPVIMLTADMAPGLAGECLREGADDFLTKPVDMDALFKAIGRVAVRNGEGC